MKKQVLFIAMKLAMTMAFTVPGAAQVDGQEPNAECSFLHDQEFEGYICSDVSGSELDTLSCTTEGPAEEGDILDCTTDPGGLFDCLVLEVFEEGGHINLFCAPAEEGGNGNGGGSGGSGGGAAAPLELTQETEQEAESGDVDQSVDVSQTGDNSNQCAGVQGVTNTGNPQNVIDLLQAGSEADDLEFEEVGSDITVDGTNETTCDQQVNQAASASG